MKKISRFLRLIIIIASFPFLLHAAQQEDYFGGDDVDAVVAMAEAGDAEAQMALAQRYRFGVGVPQNPATAVEWFQKAAVQGNVQGQFSVGYMYMDGENGFEKNLEKAAEWFRKAAENGHPTAQANLGIMYINGDGVEKNPETSLFWLQKAVDQDYAPAQSAIGWMYAAGDGVPKDTERAIDLLYQKAAESGNAYAQFALALRYIDGDGVESDPKKAIELYQKAAEQGHVGSMINLANIYAEGKLTRKNLTKAGELLLKAAELGERGAQYNIGLMYYRGKGVKKDRAAAFQWLQKAAKQQLYKAQEDLARMYLKGDGVMKDEIEGLAWLYLAYENTPSIILPYVQNIAGDIASLEKKLHIEKTQAARRRSGEIRHAINLEISARTGVPAPEPLGYLIGSGSGVVISNDGLILTSAHIVAGAESIKIKTILSPRTFTAEILEIDKDNDIAILKYEGSATPMPVTSSENIRLDQILSAVLSPRAVENYRQVWSMGIMVRSLTGARKDPGYMQVEQGYFLLGAQTPEAVLRTIRTDSSKRLLNSVGGPVVDEFGNFIGMIPQRALSGDGFVYVLRSDVLRPLLKKYGVEIVENSGNKSESSESRNAATPGRSTLPQELQARRSIVMILAY